MTTGNWLENKWSGWLEAGSTVTSTWLAQTGVGLASQARDWPGLAEVAGARWGRTWLVLGSSGLVGDRPGSCEVRGRSVGRWCSREEVRLQRASERDVLGLIWASWREPRTCKAWPCWGCARARCAGIRTVCELPGAIWCCFWVRSEC